MDEMLRDLESFANAIGVSGFEGRIRGLIEGLIVPVADEVWTDPLGNLLAIKKGRKDHPRVLLDAHMDEVGFMVSHIEDRGFLRFVEIGGWDDRNLLGHPVRFDLGEGFREGIIGTKPPHLQNPSEREKVVKSEKMFVDVGAGDRPTLRSLGIEVGTPFTIYHPFRMLDEVHAMGKAFDDRVGCAMMVDVLRRLEGQDHDPTILFNFSVCEEIGGRGAVTGAYALEPDLALALENTAAGDIPGVPPERCPASLGGGPAITIADKSLIASPSVVSRLRRLSDDGGLTYQIKKPIFGGTDAGKIATSRSGVASGVLSVPCRYIHNGLSLLNYDDMKASRDLALGFCLAPE
jgi:putative aminopeptidase FrvX